MELFRRIRNMKYIPLSLAIIVLLLCSCHNSKTNLSNDSELPTETHDAENFKITASMAHEGINNYCQQEYDLSIAKDNPDMTYIQMGNETETEYQVVFRSYTGAFVCFFIDKTNGITKIVERVPNLDIEEEIGTINLFYYLEKKN